MARFNARVKGHTFKRVRRRCKCGSRVQGFPNKQLCEVCIQSRVWINNHDRYDQGLVGSEWRNGVENRAWRNLRYIHEKLFGPRGELPPRELPFAKEILA